MIDPDLVALYTESLQDLKENNRICIHNLTDHARDHEADAESVAIAIEQFIQKCDPGKRLFVLYVLDSIVKNVKGRYIDVFAPRLLTIFSAVWDALPTQKDRLLKVLRLWNGHFAEDVLQPLRDRVGLETPGATTPQMSPESPGSYQPTRPAGAHQAYYQATAAPLVQVPAYPQYLSATVTMGGHAAPAMALPQPGFQGQAFARASTMSATAYMQPHMMQPAMGMYAAQPQAYAMGPAAVYGSAAVIPHRGASLAAVNPYQQQAYAAPTSVSAPAVAEPAPAQPEVQHSDESALRALGNMFGAKASTSVSTPASQVLQVYDFASLPLKEFHPAVIEELQKLSDHHRPQLLNIQFTRRRRQKLNPARQRQWFATTEQWVVVTVGVSDAPPTFFEEDERVAEELPECSEPLDESQTECAISGDTFEVFWDAATETHRYRHAKRLYGEEAASYGVPDGSLVNAKSLHSFGQQRAVQQQGNDEEAGEEAAAGDGADAEQPAASGSRDEAMADAAEAHGEKRPHDGAGAATSVLPGALPAADEDALAAAHKKIKMDPDAVEPAAVNC